MSEEEIIKIIKEYLSKEYIECTKIGAVSMPNEEWYAIQALLDLYNKEKEKNKELKVLIERNLKYSHNLEKDLFENCSNYVVSKDKIRKKISVLEKIQSEFTNNEELRIKIITLKDLLLEE